MSIESQAAFFCRSVCDYDPGMDSSGDIPASTAAGFAEFSALLRTIYQDWRSFETSAIPGVMTKIGIMSDDLENYHNLTYTVLCLSAIAETGELCGEGLHVCKNVFKSVYKKTTPVMSIFAMLEKYGFSFTYFKGEKQAADYKRCDNFNVYFQNGGTLLEAMKYIAVRLSEPERRKDFSKKTADIHSRMPGGVAFATADYHLILTGQINRNPVDQSILRLLGPKSGLWQELVALLRDECGLDQEAVEIACCPYVFPEKTVYFKQKKKTVCKFEMRAGRLSVWLPESFESAINLILSRENLPPGAFTPLARFGCAVHCWKCSHGAVCAEPKTLAAIDLSG